MVLTVSVVDEVIKYARKRESFEHTYSKTYFPRRIKMSELDKYSDTVEYKNCQESRKALENYLDSLNYDVIKELQVLMYLGRDDAYADELIGMNRFQKYCAEFDCKGWNSKEIEINMIIEKLPLADYLIKGKEIIGW